MKVHFDDLAMLIFNAASEEAQHVRHPYVTPEHIFFCALQFHFVRGIFELLDVDILELEEEIHRYLSYINEVTTVEKIDDATPKHSPGFDKFLEYSVVHMYKSQNSYINIKNILHALIDIEEVQATQFLKSRNITHEKISKILDNKFFEKYLKDKHDENMNSSFDVRDAFSLEDAEQEEYFSSFYATKKHQEDDETFLKKFTKVLSTDIEEHDIFVGQESTIRNVFEVLVRRRKNNVILVGDPGVGKTALVREIGARIFAKDVPKDLEEFILLELNIVALVAGTRYRGDFEDRVRRLTHAISDKKCIVFIDEIHTILGVGGSSSGANDLSDFIKPLLMESNVRFVGATTFEEYKKLEHEKALFRRFYSIEIPESNKQETEQILRSVRHVYEKFYNVQYPDNVLQTIVRLSNDFLRERRFPDKAIDILDSVGAMLTIDEFSQKRIQGQNAQKEQKNSHNAVRLRSKKKKHRIITEKQIEILISKITKRPVASVSKNEFMHLIALEDRLNNTIFGQKHAVHSVTRAIRRAKSGVATMQKPLLSALFVGPTGVGKTELSKQLSEELGMAFHRFDMSEYQEKHSVSKFIGSPPGYVGHEHGGVFVDKVRRAPHSVVLLDEIEKAHSDVFNLLLQIMDYGFITDSLGIQADFRNTILIMTSNAGIQEAMKAPIIGFGHMEQKGNEEINNAVNKFFSPEFRNRLDDIIIFNSLQLADVRGVVIKELKAIEKNLMEKRIALTWTAGVVLYLAHKGYSPIFGARNVIRTIDVEIRDILAGHVISALSKSSKTFHAESDNSFPVRLELCMKRGGKSATKKTVGVHTYIDNVLITDISRYTRKMPVV